MARCLVCPGGQEIPAVELLDHLRLLHPDVYGDGPQRWPDGRLVVYDLAENAEPDTTFTYSELLEALQEGTDREITNSHVYAAVAAANKGLLTDHKRYLGVVRGLGYRPVRRRPQRAAAVPRRAAAQVSLRHVPRGGSVAAPVTPLERLTMCGGMPDEYSWATVAIGVSEAQEIIVHVDDLTRRLAEADATIADLRRQLADTAPRRCSDCGRTGRRLKPWIEAGETVAWLGPTCWRRRAETAERAVAMPLGGER